MAIICPTVLAESEDIFQTQLARVESLTNRIQIDLTDGEFVAPKTLSLNNIYWPQNLQADIHLMYAHPSHYISDLVEMRPNLVLIHKESEDDLLPLFDELRGNGIKCGVVLLQATSVESARREIEVADHAMIFAGSLGSYGGDANLDMLAKVAEIRAINPGIEIGWDGGVNNENALQIADAGVDVINVGGFIQKADNPRGAYAIIDAKINSGGTNE